MRPNSHSAFTLIELLVVIAIIAILAALAMPAVGGAMESSQRSKCASNMKSIGAGIHLYAADNDGRLPGILCGGDDEEASWIRQLRPYLGTNYARVRVCPADPNAGTKLQQNDATSYLLTERVNADAFYDGATGELVPGEAVFDRLVRIPKPSRAIIMFIGNTNKTGRHDDHIHVGVMSSWSGVRGEIWPDAFGGGAPDGTAGSANYLFADGHVQNIAAATLKERVESGQDITVEF